MGLSPYNSWSRERPLKCTCVAAWVLFQYPLFQTWEYRVHHDTLSEKVGLWSPCTSSVRYAILITAITKGSSQLCLWGGAKELSWVLKRKFTHCWYGRWCWYCHCHSYQEQVFKVLPALLWTVYYQPPPPIFGWWFRQENSEYTSTSEYVIYTYILSSRSESAWLNCYTLGQIVWVLTVCSRGLTHFVL